MEAVVRELKKHEALEAGKAYAKTLLPPDPPELIEKRKELVNDLFGFQPTPYQMAAEQVEFLANRTKKPDPNQVILEDINGYDMFLNRDKLFQKPICRIIRLTDEYDNWVTNVIYLDGETLQLELSDDGHDDIIRLAQEIEDKSWKAENSRPFNV